MTPIFIGGCERSGTTLLGAMLGGHDECLTIPESQFLFDVLPTSSAFSVDVVEALEVIRRHWRFHIWDIDIPSLPSPPPASVPALFEWLVHEYARCRGQADASRWVDHTGRNAKYSARLFEWFPNAKLLHIVRDGRAVASSIMSRDWGPNTIIEAARWWESRLAYGLAAEQHFGPRRVLRIRYEDLVTDAKATMSVVAEFLDLQFQENMLTGRDFRVPVYTQEQHTLIGKPLCSDRINAWETQLAPREVQLFESRTGDLLRMLGYSLRYATLAQEPTHLENLELGMRERYRWIRNSFRWRRRIRRTVSQDQNRW